MITALALLGYAACAAWWAPALLAPLTRRGASVRAGLAAWLAAMASVLVSAAVAIESSFRTVAADWPQLTQAVCRSVAGGACTPAVYRSALYEGGVTALAATLALLSVVALWRYSRRVQRSRAQTRSHARTALLVGRALAGPADAVAAAAAGARAVTLDDPRPAAYCVAGRPAAIVVTSGALTVLDPPQLRAVLAHERAHLAQGHHVLATVTRGLAAALPVPLFTRGATEVARLAEMSADDTAARASGRPALAAALIAIATGARYPSARIPGAGRPGTGRPGPGHPGASHPGTDYLDAGHRGAGRPGIRHRVAGLPGAGYPATGHPSPDHGGAGYPGAGLPRGALAAAACAVPDRVERLLRPASRATKAACTAALALTLAALAAVPPALTLLAAR